MKLARAHHYVPVFYLAGFTKEGNPNSTLWVFDRQQDRSWQASPRNVANQRDFYRAEFEGVEPDGVEKAFGQFEGRCAAVLRNVSQARALPKGEDLSLLFGFLALQTTRVPQFRQAYEQAETQMTTAALRVALSCPEYFEEVRKQMRRDGVQEPKNFSRQAMIDFLEDENRWTLEIPREMSIRTMLDVGRDLIPVLAARQWILLETLSDEDDFICSDRPVILVPTDETSSRLVGFGMRRTAVIMPLNRDMALLGHFGKESGLLPADRTVVAAVNQEMRAYSHRFIYASDPHFPILPTNVKPC
jgi:hypothetical protein